ncbi:hypothetical protein ACTNEM_02025 [Eubacterium pyruvativorans]|uniref:hypothetical protein n=1 Tax=Eubacterium pyruvativorans TaxID=155865 RepID=UPI003F8989CB
MTIGRNWMEQLADEFGRMYGKAQGRKIQNTVMPGIMADFRRELDRSLPGTLCQQRYTMEEGGAALTMEGYRETAGGVPVRIVTAVTMNGRRIPLTDIMTGEAGLRI